MPITKSRLIGETASIGVVRVPPEDKEALQRCSEGEGKTQNLIVVEALEEYLGKRGYLIKNPGQ